MGKPKRMVKNEYHRGYRFERRIRDLLRGQGFVVVRGAASKPIDLVAFKDGVACVVECKASPAGYTVEKMKNETLEMYNTFKVPSVLAVRDGLGIAWCIALPIGRDYSGLIGSLAKALGNRFIRLTP
jgi:hypothetical protein